MSKRFNKFIAIKDISLVMEKGKINCLLGHDGSGKTMLINFIAGLCRPTAGVIYFDGQILSESKKEKIQAKANIGLCLSDDFLINGITVY